MPPRKTPTSSLSAIELLVKRIWYRSRARIQRIRSRSTSPETSAIRASPASRLPLELVQEITAYLSDDVRSLRTCSLTCYSWYIASVPHLHQVFIIDHDSSDKWRWPNQLLHMHALGLLPLVKVVWIRGDVSSNILPLDPRILRQFRALDNVRQLMIDHLDIPPFMSSIRHDIGHFLPTVQHLSLREPKGSRREIIYFIGLFQHLNDLGLVYDVADLQEEPVGNPMLFPHFTPPLRGSLIVCFAGAGLLRDMITLFGGLRFRHVTLFGVDGTRLLLDACAQTLETLQLDSADPRVKSSLQDFDLSRIKSLRRLRIVAVPVGWRDEAHRTASNLIGYLISTVTSPTFFEIVIVSWKYDFCGIDPWADQDQPPSCEAPQAGGRDKHLQRLIFSGVMEGEDTRCLLCLHIWEPMWKVSSRVLIETAAEEKEQKRFADLLSEPVVIWVPRRSRFFR